MTSPFPKVNLIGDYATSVIRTGVAAAVGVVVSWAVRHGFSIDQASATTYVTPLAFMAYYTVARYLEHRWPQMGVLLGIPAAPSYRKPTVQATVNFGSGTTTGNSGSFTFDPPLPGYANTTSSSGSLNVLGQANDPTPDAPAAPADPPADPPAEPDPPAVP